MSFRIADKNEVAELAKQSFGFAAKCDRQRETREIEPPLQSFTARHVFATLSASPEVIKVAFVDGGDDGVISCYDDTIKTVFIRMDKRYKLTEYNVEMPPVVLLYHEFGHAMQYLDGSGPRLMGEDGSNVYTGGNKAAWDAGKKVMKPNRGKVSQFAVHGYAVNLETNNMRMYEWPISRELGVPTRSTYLDIALWR